MAATVTLLVYFNTNLSSVGPVAGIDFISADNGYYSSGNRTTYPITRGTRSYEKWLRCRIDAAPDNYVSNFRVWGDGAVQSSTVLYIGKTSTGVTPTNSTSSVATNNFTNYTSGNKFSWHSTSMSSVGSLTSFLVLQLRVNSDAVVGNWTQEQLSYSYDEG